jgi:hypothetical protein
MELGREEMVAQLLFSATILRQFEILAQVDRPDIATASDAFWWNGKVEWDFASAKLRQNLDRRSEANGTH